ncbi:MAG: ImmA/IrrE family metallo-endopeptidase [Clostridiaceae bacterium]
MGYQELLSEYDDQVLIFEKPQINNGYYFDGVIAIKNSIQDNEKNCILAEELGHHFTSSGDISNLKDTRNVKQEKRARKWAINKLIPIEMFIQAFEKCRLNRYEMAEDLNVTEAFLEESIEYYRQKFGTYIQRDKYIIMLEPTVTVVKLF